MTIQHKQLASGRWTTLTFFEQMAHVGSEVERTIRWSSKGNRDYSEKAFDRSIELLDLTIQDVKNKPKLRELVRVREALADYFCFDNQYQSSDDRWQRYFGAFTFAARSQF